MAVTQEYDFALNHFPLVIVTSPEKVDDAEVRRMFARFDELYRAGKRYAVTMDTTATREMPTAKQRKLLADLSRASADESRRWCVGVAMVVTSAVLRGVMTAVQWAAPAPTAMIHVPTLKEGVDWCCTRLTEEGLEIPAGLERYRARVA